jgi:hypothetical protein
MLFNQKRKQDKILEAERHKQVARRPYPENKEEQRIMRSIIRKKLIIDQMRLANAGQEDTHEIKASVNDLVETVKSRLELQKKSGNDSGLKPQSSKIQNETETEISKAVKLAPEEFAKKHFLNLQKYESMYKPINNEIERQIALVPEDDDEDGIRSADAYNRIIVQIAVSTFFAPLYPLSFLFTWILAFCDYYINSRKLIYWNRRTDPRTSFTIGHWKTIIYALSWVLPISSSFILTTHYAPEYNRLAKFTFNVILIVLNFFVKHVVLDEGHFGG